MNLADGRMTEQTMDTLADTWGARWNHVLVVRQMSHATDIWMDLSV